MSDTRIKFIAAEILKGHSRKEIKAGIKLGANDVMQALNSGTDIDLEHLQRGVSLLSQALYRLEFLMALEDQAEVIQEYEPTEPA